MRDGLKPPKGLKKQFFGVVLALVGLCDMAATVLMYGLVDGVDVFFIAAGAAVFAYGWRENRKYGLEG